MQEKVVISIANGAEPKGSAEKVESMFADLLRNRTRLEQLLLSYYFRSRGRVFDVEIHEPVFIAENRGYFKVQYKIGHFYACADMDTHEEEQMQIDFEIDPSTAQALLTGEYFPEREPDEF